MSTKGPSVQVSAVILPSKTYSQSAGTKSPLSHLDTFRGVPCPFLCMADAMVSSSVPKSTDRAAETIASTGAPIQIEIFSSLPSFLASLKRVKVWRGTRRMTMVSLSLMSILWKDTFLLPLYSETTMPAEMYLPASLGKYLTMGSLVRSSSSSCCLNCASETSSVAQGADMASMTWVTISSLPIPMALAILALVENTLPAAFPPFRSVNRKVVS